MTTSTGEKCTTVLRISRARKEATKKGKFFFSFLDVEHHAHSSFLEQKSAPTENAGLVYILQDTADMLRQNVRTGVLARNEGRSHESLVCGFFGVELRTFVRSALLRVHSVLDLGDRRRTVVEYPHTTVALMHEPTPKAGE